MFSDCSSGGEEGRGEWSPHTGQCVRRGVMPPERITGRPKPHCSARGEQLLAPALVSCSLLGGESAQLEPPNLQTSLFLLSSCRTPSDRLFPALALRQCSGGKKQRDSPPVERDVGMHGHGYGWLMPCFFFCRRSKTRMDLRTEKWG